MSEDKILVKLQIKDPNLKRQFENVLRSVIGFNSQDAMSKERTDLLIFELGDEIDKELKYIKDSMNSGEVGEVYFVSDHSDQTVLLQIIRTGAREFFSPPINDEEIKQALQEFKAGRIEIEGSKSFKEGKIINIVGSKGGVGTTTIAVNLAFSLIERKSVQSVALIDMNLLFGDIPLFLEIEPKYNWGEIASRISRLDDTLLKHILSVDASGVCVIPSPNYLNLQHTTTPEIMEQLLTLMRQAFDFVIIDLGQSLDVISLKILELSDTVLLVSILSPPSLLNTNKLLRTFRDSGYPQDENIKIVANRYLTKSKMSIKDAEVSLDKEIFWTIPNDYQTTVNAINEGKALVQVAPRKAITNNFRKLAAKLSP